MYSSSGVDDHLAARRALPPSSSTSTMDEEAQKRNTDCVYFLASPLTCKKGSSCEYRHSEAARMNPRDCWFWISSNCLNAHCSFRHPPLEGRPVSASVPPPPVSVASTAAATGQSASAASTLSAAVPSKSKTPCFFFSQGFCAKNDKCPFMHGPSVASSTDAAAQQFPPKARYDKAEQANSKPVPVLKGNDSILQKQTSQEMRSVIDRIPVARFEAQPVSSKAPVPAQGLPQLPNGFERVRIPESSVTSTLSRHEKALESRNSKKTQFSGDRFQDVQDPVDKLKQGQTKEKRQQQLQGKDEHLWPVQAADQRNENGFRSDAWWKEASPDFEGNSSDQSTQREDGEYSLQSESQGRRKGLDDLAGFRYEPLNSYGQAGSDSISAQHRQHSYEQRMDHGYGHHGSVEHMKHHSFSWSARTSVRGGQRMESEGHTTTGDLRHHLMNRRKNDRGHNANIDSFSKAGHSEMVGKPHLSKRLRDDYPKQQDQRHGEIHSSSGRADSRGVKRALNDGGSSPDSLALRVSSNRRLGTRKSPNRVLSRSSPTRGPVMDHLRTELKERESVCRASEAAPVLDVRNHLSSKNTRLEHTKESSAFTGPKSLALIKAERKAEAESGIKAFEGRGFRRHLEAHTKLADERSAVSASKLGRTHMDSISTNKKGGDFEYETANPEDFEGPKPLSLLLKKKRRKVESDGDVEEIMAGPNKAEVSMADLSREIEDGEVRDEEDELKHEDSHETYASVMPLQEELQSRSPSDANKGGTLEGVLRSPGVEEAQDDMDSSEDGLRLGVEMGENASGDDDYGLDVDDDDEDDFAKKLGGFVAFSSG